MGMPCWHIIKERAQNEQGMYVLVLLIRTTTNWNISSSVNIPPSLPRHATYTRKVVWHALASSLGLFCIRINAL